MRIIRDNLPEGLELNPQDTWNDLLTMEQRHYYFLATLNRFVARADEAFQFIPTARLQEVIDQFQKAANTNDVLDLLVKIQNDPFEPPF